MTWQDSRQEVNIPTGIQNDEFNFAAANDRKSSLTAHIGL